MFNEFFKSSDKIFKNASEINLKEVFYLPNLMNLKNCKFIQYGHHSIYEVLAQSKPHYYTQSVLKQLEKTERNFVYHLILLPKWQRYVKGIVNNGRIYRIHVNMSQQA